MKIGICSSELEKIKNFYKMGYDFIEVNTLNIRGKSEDELTALAEFNAECGGEFLYSANCIAPGEMRLTGEGVDYDEIRRFTRESFGKLARIGIKMIVFGSGKAKVVPEGFSHDEAMKQLVEVTRIFAEEAEKHGMRVCIEPLRRAECNIINTVPEAHELARLADRANVGAHADYYHMMQNGESMSVLTPLASDIIHTHIASPCIRNLPLPEDGADYAAFFTALRRGGYNATVAYEGGGADNDGKYIAMLAYLKSLLA